jgi:outer membrane protein assembly factor BamB
MNLLKKIAITIAAGGILLWAQSPIGPIAPLPENAVRKGQDWTKWFGSNGANSAQSDNELVASAADIKLVWLSDEEIPGSYYRCVNVYPGIRGGWSSPVVYNGKVYLYYYKPNGVIRDEARYGNPNATYGSDAIKDSVWLVSAADIIHCFDAQTGKTLWKKSFNDNGLNLGLRCKNSPWNITPCISDGKIYAIGSTGKLACMSAETGDTLWVRTVGPRAATLDSLRDTCLALKSIPSWEWDLASAPVVAQGVVVCSDFMSYKVEEPVNDWHWDQSCGLIGRDAQTGDSLWHLRNKLTTFTSPKVWKHGDKEYIIAPVDNNQHDTAEVICIEPRTGEIIWTIQNAGYMAFNELIIEGDQLVINGAVQLSPTLESFLPVCYRLYPDSAKKLWDLCNVNIPCMPYRLEKRFSAIYDNHLYIYSDAPTEQIICIDMADGAIKGTVAYHRAHHGGFLIAADGRVITDQEREHIGFYNADPNNFGKMGEDYKVSEGDAILTQMSVAHAAYADGRLFVRREDRMACYDLRKSALHVKSGGSAHAHSPAFIFEQAPNRIALQTGGAKVNIALFDITGRMLFEKRNATALKLSLATLPGGYYVLRAQHNNATVYQRRFAHF